MKKVLVIFIAFLILSACTASIMREPGNFDQFAQCLTDKGVKMYGTNTCSFCKKQKESFKGSFDLVNYIECTQNPVECQEAGIEGYPTWLIDGKNNSGLKSLSELSELTACELS